MARHAGQLGIVERLGPDEERHDEVVEVEACLAHEVAEPARPPQPAEPGYREGRHAYSLDPPSGQESPGGDPGQAPEERAEAEQPQQLT